MKLFVCDVSDDEPEEDVSEEEQSDDDEANLDNAVSDEEEKATQEKPINTNSEATKPAAKVNGKSNKTEESENSSDASVTTDEDDELDINGIKSEPQDKNSKFTATKSPRKAKLMDMPANVPARQKNTSIETMVLAAVRSLSERGGSSAIAIKKFIMNNYPQLDGERTMKQIKKYIKRALGSGVLIQSKGTGLGGSFKLSAKTIRPKERKEKRSHKRLKESKDNLTDEKASKGTTKTKENSVKKVEKTKKNAKSKVTLTLNGTAEATVKGPKASAALPKVINLKQTKPTTASKEAKPSTTEKSKVTKQNKSSKNIINTEVNVKAEKPKKATPAASAPAHTLNGGETSPTKAEPKGKVAAKKQATVKGKAAAKESVEIGSGDADTVKPAKKTAGRKAKAK